MTEKELHEVKAIATQIEQLKYIYNNLGKALDLLVERVKMALGEQANEPVQRGAFQAPTGNPQAKGTGHALESLDHIPNPSIAEIKSKTINWDNKENFNRQ